MGTAPRYTFAYNAQGKLSGVDANIAGQPDAVVIGHSANDGRVTSITDPDGLGVQFQYAAARPYTPAVRVDRRGTAVRFGYGVGNRLNTVKVPLAPGDTLVSEFAPAEAKGISASYPLTQTYTRLNSPRTDVSDFTYLYLGRWGAPERIRDAMGRETVIERTGPFPASPTAVTTPGGLRSSVVYDARGRVGVQVLHNPFGDGLNDTTRYEYDDRWNAPTRISRQRAARRRRAAAGPDDGDTTPWATASGCSRATTRPPACTSPTIPSRRTASGRCRRCARPRPRGWRWTPWRTTAWATWS